MNVSIQAMVLIHVEGMREVIVLRDGRMTSKVIKKHNATSRPGEDIFLLACTDIISRGKKQQKKELPVTNNPLSFFLSPPPSYTRRARGEAAE